MTRWTIALATLSGAVAAAAGGYWLTARTRDTDVPQPSSMPDHGSTRISPFTAETENPRLLSNDEAHAQRALQYRDVESIATVRQLPSEFARREALYVVAGRADEDDLRDLIAQARALANESERGSSLEILLLRYAELDPEAAVRAALELDRNTASRVVGALARVVPEKAWDAVGKVSDPLARNDYRLWIIESWALLQPRQAFASVTALPTDRQRPQLLRQVTAEIARADPRLAIELTEAANPTDSNAMFAVIAAEWARYDPPAAARWIESLELSRQGLAYQVAGPYLTRSREEALAWALRNSRSPGRNLWSSMVGQIAVEEPQEAFRLAQSAENLAQRSQATQEVLAAIAQRDPAMAMSYLHKLPEGQMRAQATTQVAMHIAQRSPSAAIDWIDTIEDRELRIEVVSQIAQEVAQNDVEAAARMVERVPKEARSAWIASVAEAYSLRDVDKGIQWLAKYRDEPGDFIGQFAQAVAVRDTKSAVDAIERLSEGRQRDRLLSTVIPTIAHQSPETAAQALAKISDDTTRANSVGTITDAWVKYDETAARKWVMSLERGRARDTGLFHIVGTLLSVDDIVTLVGQIQSPDQRMEAVMYRAVVLSRQNPEGARTLLRRYPLDPQRQSQVDQFVKQSNRAAY